MTQTEIENALLATSGTYVGAQVPCQARGIRQFMIAAGLIGENMGLTRAGSILAERLKNAQLDNLFPL